MTDNISRSHVSWHNDLFDTNLFGIKIAKIDSLSASKTALTSLLNQFHKDSIKYATYRFPAHEIELQHFLERSGFITVDNVISLEKELIKNEYFPQNASVCEAEDRDKEALKKIARNSFKVTRVYTDPLLSKKAAGEFYAQWITNSVRHVVADKVFIYKQEHDILGFVTIQNKGHIPLIAVSKNAQSKGVGRTLVQAGLNYLVSVGVSRVEIETQVTNIAAIRSYQSCGFKIFRSYVTMRWALD